MQIPAQSSLQSEAGRGRINLTLTYEQISLILVFGFWFCFLGFFFPKTFPFTSIFCNPPSVLRVYLCLKLKRLNYSETKAEHRGGSEITGYFFSFENWTQLMIFQSTKSLPKINNWTKKATKPLST